jgi:peptidoglycan hydrolase-like protein with peptidoglycan-binding domain
LPPDFDPSEASRAGYFWVGSPLIVLFASIAVLAVWGLPLRLSDLLPSDRIEQAKAGASDVNKREERTPLPASVARLSPPPVPPEARPSTPPESPPKSMTLPVVVTVNAAPLTPDEIRELQGRLKAAGFYAGAIDGTMGRQTRAAVREYAEARALPNADATRADATRWVLTRLKAEPPAPASSAPISPPSPRESARATPEVSPSAAQIPATAQAGPAALTPDEIRELQDKLTAVGFDPGPIDGTMGRQTRRAVREYTEARALPNTPRDLLDYLRTEPRP